MASTSEYEWKNSKVEHVRGKRPYKNNNDAIHMLINLIFSDIL